MDILLTGFFACLFGFTLRAMMAQAYNRKVVKFLRQSTAAPCIADAVESGEI
jgi:hypothetical protein